ncbi:MAG: hypothetical protein H7126_19320 [Candidatus Parcubacteria bacterium]|uniref:hypothetical protein n=1 Tax=Phormidesmis priestleyi TaxID=268141 RepID=UPI00083ABCEB|nr:hypothetical protein [Phormidesmis priestleyi]MBC7825976.1 hypothetical protein [Leptolyngbyaceae cyanobacterium LF-bin-113]
MNLVWSRMFRTVYRKEPITGFVLIAGAVDVAIGGIDGSTSLVVFGLSSVGVAIALRLWQSQKRTPDVQERVAIHALPPSSSRPSLPMLSMAKKNPPQN